MDKEKIEQLNTNAQLYSGWMESAREKVAEDKGKGSGSDTKDIDEDVFKQYMKEHSDKGDYEYLVRGAKLRCRHGSHIRMMNLPLCHGVYIGENPMVHENDCIQGTGGQGNISWFGVCTAEHCQNLPGEDVCYELTEENSASDARGQAGPGKKCSPVIVGVWQDVYDRTKIVDNWEGDAGEGIELSSLTTGSFLVCAYGGIIEPVTSGQGRPMTQEDLGLDENGKSPEGNTANEKEWEEIEARRKEKAADCGKAECFLAHERYAAGDKTDHGSIHGTNYYKVVFQYEDGEIIEEQEVKGGDCATEPKLLRTRVDYLFREWDKDFDNVNSDMVITAIGVYKIKDKEINPQGIPLYSGKTMVCDAEFHTFNGHIEATYGGASVTRDSTHGEGASYRFIHPKRFKEDVDVSGTGYNDLYHGTYWSGGNCFSLADNRMEVAVRRGVSCVNGDRYNDVSLAGEYIDIVLSDGTVLACILGASKGDEEGSSEDGLVHGDHSIIELLAVGNKEEKYPYGACGPDRMEILHGEDMVGFYTYPSLRLYDLKEKKISLLFFRRRGSGMKKFVYCIGVCIALFLTGCSREDNAVNRDDSVDNQPQSSVQAPYMFSEPEYYIEESETGGIPECDVNDRPLKQVDSGKLFLLHDSEWYPYEDILFEGDYEKAGYHDFMNSRGQFFHMWVYRELSDMLYDYSQRINDNLLTDGWTVERIIPIGDDCYNVLIYQEASGSRVALLFNSSEMEYKILYLHDIHPFSSETHYMSQFDWVPFDREEKATAADRIDNPFEDIHEAEESHCLNVVVATYERENGYTGYWKVQEFYGDAPCCSGLLVSDGRMVWFCMNVGLHEYIAETFYYVNEEH